MLAGTDINGTEIIFAIYARTGGSKSNFYTYPEHKNATYSGVKVWEQALRPKLSTQKAHMKKVQPIWMKEIGQLYQEKTKAAVKEPAAALNTSPGAPNTSPRTPRGRSASAPTAPDSSSRKRSKLGRTDDQLFWTPNGEVLTKAQTTRMALDIK